MECPKEVLEAVTEILYIAILRIRNKQGKDLRYCSIEADHVHNLPSLIQDYSEDLLKYYLDIERPIYIKDSLDTNHNGFEIQWKKLEGVLQQSNNSYK